MATAGGLTGRALHGLLERLGRDPDAAAAEFETIRRRLLDFFDRRGIATADVRADETLDRVARRIDAGEQVENVRAYCYGVAKKVLLEWQREETKEAAALRAFWPLAVPESPSPEVQARVACLERCLLALPAERRELIVRYYEGEGTVHLEARKRLADAFSVTQGTLKTRAYRIRAQLEQCLLACLREGGNR
jgi:DNA-directed RNA polymerase specialized sigma24 family protein